MGLLDASSRTCHPITMAPAVHELTHGTARRVLHGDALERGPLAKGGLFVVGQSKRHGHERMVSL